MIADTIGQPNFVNLIQQFLYDQHCSDNLIRSLRRHPALPHLSSRNFAGKSVCSNRPLPHFLHLAISPELVACCVSAFMLLILGEMVLVGVMERAKLLLNNP